MSDRPRVSLSLIVKDGEPYFARCLASVVKPITIPRYNGAPAFAEIVVLVDSRTSDRSEQIAREFAAKQEAIGGTFKIARHDWPNHFGEARQRSFEMASGDWRGWIDADDEMVGAEYVTPHISESFKRGEVALHLPYHYIVAPDGTVKSKLWRERFVKWDYGWRWVGSVHEHLVPTRGYVNAPMSRITDEVIRYVHLPSESEINEHLARNARLTDPDSAPDRVERSRMLYFKGRDLRESDRKGAEACWRELLGLLGMLDSTALKLARYELAGMMAEDGRFAEAKAEALTYIEKNPNARSGALLMSNIYAMAGEAAQSVKWFERAMEIPPEVDPLGRDESGFAAMASEQALRAGLGMAEAVRVESLVAENFPPGAGGLPARILRSAIRTSRTAEAVAEYGKYAVDHDEFKRVLTMHTGIPYPLKRNERLAIERRRVREYLRKHGTNERNQTWRPIEEKDVADILADNRASFVVFGRALWVAERVWAKGWERVLSLGCADGLVEGYLAARFPDVEVVGLDVDPNVIEHARKMWNLPNLRFEHSAFGPSDSSYLADLSYWCDGWICTEVLEHVGNYEDLYRPRGKPGLLTTPAAQPDHGEPPFDQLVHYDGACAHLRILTLAEIQYETEASSVSRRMESYHPFWAIEVLTTRPSRDVRHHFVFVCHGSPSAWGPETPLTRGLTGSEECVVYLAEALARDGHLVRVASAQLEGEERIVNGVMWTGLDYLAEHDLEDPTGEDTTLIVWRQPTLTLPIFDTLRASRRVLWLHDAASCFAGTPDELWTRFDTVVCATEYHKRTIAEAYPCIADRTVAIRHGIPEMPVLSKIPGRVVYASSPDRGLERLLDWWPDVKARVPHATLSVFYGRDNLRVFAMMNPHLGAFGDRIEAKLEAAKALGVTDHGLVPHRELHRHFAEAQVHVYPSTFEEISCLTIQKTQAARCVPVYSPSGCLREVVAMPPFWDDLSTLDGPEAKAAFVEAMVRAFSTLMLQVGEMPTWEAAAKAWAAL